MRRKWKLVKQRGGLDAVRLRERVQVLRQRFGVARHINNAVKLGNQLQRGVVHACARRVENERPSCTRSTATVSPVVASPGRRK